MAKKEFQAESKKLMDMMINSIYTNKEIFLRELISNASDAIDKLYYKSLTDPSVGMNKGDFRILLTRDKDNRLLTVSDNGIGMTKEELEQNLAPSPTPVLWTSRRTTRTRTSTSSVSSAWASTPPSWSPTRSPSSPRHTVRTKPGSGSPAVLTATS